MPELPQGIGNPGALEGLPQKEKELPRGAGEEDRRKFAKAASYMVRLDDLVACFKCRKRFELTGQSTVLINDALGDPRRRSGKFRQSLARIFIDLRR